MYPLNKKIAEITYKQEIKTHMQMKEKDDKIRELEDNIDNLQRTEKEKYDILLENKRKMEANYEDKKRINKQQHEQNKKVLIYSTDHWNWVQIKDFSWAAAVRGTCQR